jgi:2-C-methyl-D-erythritol 4-phosphate cytidylyltransferase
MVEWSIDAFRACDSVHSIVVAAPPGHDRELGGDRVANDDLGDSELTVVVGGATRAQSVANALEAVDTELVAIHDAARPLLTPQLVDELVARLDAYPGAAGAIAAAPVTDTVKQAAALGGGPPNRDFLSQDDQKSGLEVERTLDRSRLWAAQTPQVFRTEALRAALEVDAEKRDAATDEAMLVEATGGTVLIHPSSPLNLKVTTPLDLRVAELLLGERAAGSVPEK